MVDGTKEMRERTRAVYKDITTVGSFIRDNADLVRRNDRSPKQLGVAQIHRASEMMMMMMSMMRVMLSER